MMAEATLKIPKTEIQEPEQEEPHIITHGRGEIASDQLPRLAQLEISQRNYLNFEDTFETIGRNQNILLTNFLSEIEEAKRIGKMQTSAIIDYLTSVWLTSKDNTGNTKVDDKTVHSIRKRHWPDSHIRGNLLAERDNETTRHKISAGDFHKQNKALLKYVSPSGVTLVRYILDNFRVEIYNYLLNLQKWDSNLISSLAPETEPGKKVYQNAYFEHHNLGGTISYVEEFKSLVIILHCLLGYCGVYEQFPELSIFENSSALTNSDDNRSDLSEFFEKSPYRESSLEAKQKLEKKRDAVK
jgi:hypothetical protein